MTARQITLPPSIEQLWAWLSTLNSSDMLGTATNDDAAPGYIGEFISAEVAIGAPVALVTGTAKTVTHIDLTAGDWDAWGVVGFVPNAATTTSQLIAALNTTTNVLPTAPNGGAYARSDAALAAGTTAVIPTGTRRYSLAAPASVFLIAQASFAVNINGAFGFVAARRAR